MCHRNRIMLTKVKEDSSEDSGPDLREIILAVGLRGREIAEDALRRSDELLEEVILKEVEKDEICEEKERELEALEEEIEQLSLTDEKLQDELEEKLYKMSIAEQMKEVKVAGAKLDKLSSDIKKLDEDVKRLQRESIVTERFENSKGVKLIGFEDTNLVISFTKIVEDHPEKEYRLYIPTSLVTQKNGGKYVEKIVPSMPEFDQFIGEGKKVEGLKNFLPHIRSQLIEAIAKSRLSKTSRTRRKQQAKK